MALITLFVAVVALIFSLLALRMTILLSGRCVEFAAAITSLTSGVRRLYEDIENREDSSEGFAIATPSFPIRPDIPCSFVEWDAASGATIPCTEPALWGMSYCRKHEKKQPPKQVKAICMCETPVPCVYPVPAAGIECDNCGKWITREILL